MQKQNNYIFEIIFLPIIIIIFLITSITLYNIHTTKKQLENRIDKKKAEFFQAKKKLVLDNVNNLNNIIKIENKKMQIKVKKELEKKIYIARRIFNNIIEENKKLSIKELDNILIKRLSFLSYRNNRSYYFIFDKKGEILSHQIGTHIGKNLNDFYDIDDVSIGSKLLNSLLNGEKTGFIQYHFQKPNIKGNTFLKMAAITYIKPLDIYIGTAESLVDIFNEIKDDLINKIKINSNKKEHLTIYEVKNINGGKNFAALIISNNIKYKVGKEISDDVKDKSGIYYRKEILKLLREKGQGFYKYWYSKDDKSEVKEKYSYFYWNKSWNWIISSGFYLEDLDLQIKKLKSETDIYLEDIIKNSLYWGLIFSLVMISISTIIFYRIQKRINKDQLKLIQSKENLKKAQKISKIGSWSYIYATDELIISDETYEIFAIDKNRKKITAKYLLSFVYDDDKKKVNLLFDRLVKEKKSYEIIHRLKIDKKIKWVNNQCEVFDESNGMIIVGTIQDISEKYEKDKKIEEQSQLLFNQSKMAAMGEMIENIAHQWRQPLSAISISASGLKLESEYNLINKDKIDNCLTNIIDNTTYLSNTIEDFRKYFAKDKSVVRCNVKGVYLNTIKLLRPKFDALEIEVVEECEDLYTYTLENELVQCLMNIFNNAYDVLMKNKSGRKLLFIKISKKYDNIIIDIKDNAGGINDNIIQKVFEPYFTTKHKSQGTGIGLYMTQEIITKHLNGYIKVLNEKFEFDGQIYKGANFKISLPQELKK